MLGSSVMNVMEVCNYFLNGLIFNLYVDIYIWYCVKIKNLCIDR